MQIIAPSWKDVAAFLRDGGAYADSQAPEVIETHISLVYMRGMDVYKLKKPVRFDFLDYATPNARQVACEREVELNRRLAPDVYIGTVPVTLEKDGTLALAGSGAPVEWMVHMRRLPREKMLNNMIEYGATAKIDVAALADVLSHFYRAARPVTLDAAHLLRSMSNHVRENLAELLRPEHGLPERMIQRIHGRQLQFIHFEAAVFEKRVLEGRIIDGHGDLRPDHVCMEDRPVVFDCIEFNDELRHLDIADELCFLAMECERLRAQGLGDDIMQRCSQAIGDTPPHRLLDFYKSYRACVRSKVAALRSLQLGQAAGDSPASLAKAYLHLADRSFGWSSQPICIIVRGLAGTGKSTVASELSNTLGMALLQTDRMRQSEAESTDGDSSYGAGRYSPERRQAVYERMFEKASEFLSERVSVILDACFLSHELQKRVLALTQAIGVPMAVVNCHCPDAVATARIAARAQEPGSLSEARPEHLAAQRIEDQGSVSDAPALSIDTSIGTTAAHVHSIVLHLRQLLEGSHAGDRTAIPVKARALCEPVPSQPHAQRE